MTDAQTAPERIVAAPDCLPRLTCEPDDVYRERCEDHVMRCLTPEARAVLEAWQDGADARPVPADGMDVEGLARARREALRRDRR